MTKLQQIVKLRAFTSFFEDSFQQEQYLKEDGKTWGSYLEHPAYLGACEVLADLISELDPIT